MKLKDAKNSVKEKTKTTKISYIDGKRVVNLIDVKSLFKNNCKEYFIIYKGVNAYFFDAPSDRIHNYVVIVCEGKKYLIKIVEFILDLIFWKANILFNIPITKNEIYDYTSLSKSLLANIQEHVAQLLIDSQKKITPEICECISSIKEELSTFSQNYASVRCNTISIHSILDFKNRNKEFKELFDTELDASKTIKENENILKKAEKDLTRIIGNDKDNCLSPYIISGRLKMAQLVKVLVAVGTRPDIDKTILPWPIKRGYIHGLQNVAEYFMETITARDAIMTKNDNLPRSGFLSREINRLTSDIWVNYNVADCGSTRYLTYFVQDNNYLKMIIGKYWLNEQTGKLEIIRKDDTYLIGQTIKIRSFITCNCKHGVCLTCVGTVAKRLKDTRIGTLASIKCINPMSQAALSAKHDLVTKSIEIVNETLLKYFYSDGTDFFIKPEYASSRTIYIVVRTDTIEDIMISDIDTDDDSIDTTITLDYVAIRDHGVNFEIENEGLRLALSDEILKNKSIFQEDDENSEYTLIPFSKIDVDDSPTFYAILDTEEISKYLSSLIGTIDRRTISRFKDYNELCSAIMSIIYDAGFVNNIIHFESIVKSMLRDLNEKSMMPNWEDSTAQYQIMKISSAITNKDLYTAISYQGLRNLFKTVDIRRRYGVSLYDAFFRVSKKY